MENPIEYDRYGRMKYNPSFHDKQGLPWTRADEKYLIKWYDKIGPDEMSFALGRTATSVMQRVTELRRQGIINRTSIERRKRAFNKNF